MKQARIQLETASIWEWRNTVFVFTHCFPDSKHVTPNQCT